MYNDNQMDTNDLNVFRTVIIDGISDGCNDKVIQCNDECMSSRCFQESELIKSSLMKHHRLICLTYFQSTPDQLVGQV